VTHSKLAASLADQLPQQQGTRLDRPDRWEVVGRRSRARRTRPSN